MTLLDRVDKFDDTLSLVRGSFAFALAALIGCGSPERVFTPDDTGASPTDTGSAIDTGVIADSAGDDTAPVDTGPKGDAGPTSGGYAATATVPGGVRAESASYILITTTAPGPGGNAVLQSPMYTLKGGIVSVTQP